MWLETWGKAINTVCHTVNRVYFISDNKVMETVNVVIDEALESSFEKISEEIPK